MENVTRAHRRIRHITDMDRPIAAGEEEEDHGQWMCTNLENVSLVKNFSVDPWHEVSWTGRLQN